MSKIKIDLLAATNTNNLLALTKHIIVSHTFHLVAIYRLGCFLRKIPVVGTFAKIIFEYIIRIIFATDISLESDIGPGLVIMHGHDIVIGRNVIIGMNCKIYNGVTLGNKDVFSLENQQPILGDNVVICTGAKLLGSIKIGNDVVIGANSVVLSSFGSNAIIGGIPAKFIKPLR